MLHLNSKAVCRFIEVSHDSSNVRVEFDRFHNCTDFHAFKTTLSTFGIIQRTFIEHWKNNYSYANDTEAYEKVSQPCLS